MPRSIPQSLLAGVALFAALAGTARADIDIASRTISPNGRPVQEIRLGVEPGSNALRAVVVTNGPTAGTTTLLTAVAAPNLWYDPGQPAPVFTSLIASGTVFSVGGGCRRGNQLDFPFINNNRPQILRVQNGQASIFPLPIFGTEFFDSAECTVSPDQLQTWYVFSNRTNSRAWVMVDSGGPNDLNGPLVNFPARTPLFGGLRPQIGNIFGENRKMALLWMEVNGETRWRQFDITGINVDHNCLVGTQSPPPSGFTAPRGARVMGTSVVGDFDDNGQFEAGEVNTAACATPPAMTPAGPVAGNGFNWTEPAAVVTADGGRRYTIGSLMVTFEANGGISITGGPHAGNAGPFDACEIFGPEREDGILSVSVDASADVVRVKRIVKTPAAPPPTTGDAVFRSGAENPGSGDNLRCVEIELRR